MTIGGGSPILTWTKAQGDAMCARLDEMSPGTAPHKFYVSFRYAPPFADDALKAMKADGITRAVAFTQYPQWSCSTTGSSLNDLWRALDRTGLQDAFTWSIIDRWGEQLQRDYAPFSVSEDAWGFVVVEVTAGDDPSVTVRRISRGSC